MLSSWEKREDAVFMGRDGKKGQRSRPAYILITKQNSYYTYLVTSILKTKCCLFVKDLLILLHLFTGVNINVQYISHVLGGFVDISNIKAF
jgi:hypothetical protein